MRKITKQTTKLLQNNVAQHKQQLLQNISSTAQAHYSDAVHMGEEKIKETKQKATSVHQDYPLAVIAGVAGVFAFLTRRGTFLKKKQPNNFI